MPLSRDFKDTIKARADRDPAFRRALAQEALECLLGGDLPVGQALIRNYINATIGFEALAAEVNIPAKSLMRMLGPKGNPVSKSLFPVLKHIQEREHLEIRAVPH